MAHLIYLSIYACDSMNDFLNRSRLGDRSAPDFITFDSISTSDESDVLKLKGKIMTNYVENKFKF